MFSHTSQLGLMASWLEVADRNEQFGSVSVLNSDEKERIVLTR